MILPTRKVPAIHSAKLHPEDVPKRRPMDVPICNAKERPLATS